MELKTYEDFYKNGNLKKSGFLLNDNLHGEYKEFFDNNELKLTGNYYKGRKEGEFVYYNKNNKIQKIVNYKGDEYNGLVIIYDEITNKIKEKLTYKKGKLLGKYEKYNIYGILIEEGNLNNGERDGHIILYDDNGNKKEEFKIKKNIKNGDFIEYNQKGFVIKKGFYKKDKLNGKISFFQNGILEKEYNYTNGIKDGNYIFYYKNGQKRLEGKYSNGEMLSEHKEYDIEGNLKEINHQINGIKNGEYKTYSFYLKNKSDKEKEIFSPYELITNNANNIKQTTSIPADVLLKLAVKYKRSGQYEKANEIYTNLFKLDGGSVSLINAWAKVLACNGEYEEAIKLFDISVKSFEDSNAKRHRDKLRSRHKLSKKQFLEYLSSIAGNPNYNFPNNSYKNKDKKNTNKEKILFVSEIGTYIDNKKTGKYEIYSANDKIIEIGNYKNDKLNGLIKTYYENGKLKSTYFCVDGIKSGEFEEFLKNGFLKEKGTYLKGKKNGQACILLDNGGLKLINYKYGNYDGESILITKDKNVVKYLYNNGQIIDESECIATTELKTLMDKYQEALKFEQPKRNENLVTFIQNHKVEIKNMNAIELLEAVTKRIENEELGKYFYSVIFSLEENKRKEYLNLLIQKIEFQNMFNNPLNNLTINNFIIPMNENTYLNSAEEQQPESLEEVLEEITKEIMKELIKNKII